MAHYLITGHTGFKGAWLVFLLRARGHDVSGLALNPLPGSLFDRTNLERDLVHDFRVDVRNRDETVEAIRHAQPDYVIHLAAQALVREGYRNPLYTYETNVQGTLNLLEAVDCSDSVRAQLIITTDKVYLDQGLNRPYVETDKLGGSDPYSASKAMADILAQEFLARAGSKPGAIVRAGNVIGSGEIAQERLFSDIFSALKHSKPLLIRNPAHTRPWQHVLDCLSSYLLVLEEAEQKGFTGCWNVSTPSELALSVESVVEIVRETHELQVEFEFAGPKLFHEDSLLDLDVTKFTRTFGKVAKLNPRESVAWALEFLADQSTDERTLLVRQVETWRSM